MHRAVLPRLPLALAALALAWPLAASAQDADARDSACQSEVAKFEQAIAFIRNAQGVAAAAKLKEDLLPAYLEYELLSRQGYCGLARYLKSKKLL